MYIQCNYIPEKWKPKNKKAFTKWMAKIKSVNYTKIKSVNYTKIK